MRTIHRRAFLSRAAALTGALALSRLATRSAHAEEEWLFAPAGWDATWATARTNTGSTPAAVSILGDSITAGVLTTDMTERAWPGLLAAAARAQGIFGGDFWMTSASNAHLAAASGAPLDTQMWPGTPPWVLSLDGLRFERRGLGVLPRYSTPATLTLTTPYPVAGIDLLYYDDIPGSFAVQLDAGPVQTITTTGAGALRRLRIDGVQPPPPPAPAGRGAPPAEPSPSTVHQLVCRTGPDPAAMLIQGVWTFEDAGRGVRVGRIAYPGDLLSDLTREAGRPADRVGLWTGSSVGRTTLGHPTQPHLAIITLGINDCQGEGDAGAPRFGDGLRSLIAAFRQGALASILLVANNSPLGGPVEFRNARSWPLYREQMRVVAESTSSAFVDVDARWRNLGLVQPTHPNDEGHADIASVIVPLVLPETPVRG
jgi:lysophospholipase L1-like esterase